MSLNLAHLRVFEGYEDHPLGRGAMITRSATTADLLEAVAAMGDEPDVLGLAVQLLKQRGAVEIDATIPWSGQYSILRVERKRPGRYLVIPVTALRTDPEGDQP